MHSGRTQQNGEEFKKEVEDILRGESIYHRPKDRFDFTGFVFPEGQFQSFTFTRDVHFFKAIFVNGAAFTYATFKGRAVFIEVDFRGHADFSQARFQKDCGFIKAMFRERVDFHDASFDRIASFSQTMFFHDAHFSGAQFRTNANFTWAQFHGDVIFWTAVFISGATFMATQFRQGADFLDTGFGHELESLHTGGPLAIADFTGARFEKPAQVRFYRVNRRSAQGLRARFADSEVEYLHFDDVNWYRHRGRMILQDELDLSDPFGEANGTVISSHEAAAIVYRQLVNNYEKVRVYDLAEDCFCGAMEMKRLNPDHFIFARLLRGCYRKSRLSCWFGSHLSATYLYRFASYYGSRYVRAFAVLLFGVVIIGLLYSLPYAGLYHTDLGWVGHSSSGKITAGLFHALEVATFQRQSLYDTEGIFGKLVAVVETILVPAQLALFLLALRRRFRR
jgi:uncharacterized protein YjbI with pentapeptide repeats